MSMYVVKNDKGEWLGCEIYCNEPDWFDHGGFIWDTRSMAEENVKLYGGHVVELTESPAKVVVSKEEAEMLEQAKQNINPFYILWWNNTTLTNDHNQQEQLMRAYVNGYTVAKEKRYQLKVPYADGWIFQKYSPESKLKHHNRSDTFPVRDTGLIGRQLELTWFTAAEIEHYGLQDCKRVEVIDDDE